MSLHPHEEFRLLKDVQRIAVALERIAAVLEPAPKPGPVQVPPPDTSWATTAPVGSRAHSAPPVGT